MLHDFVINPLSLCVISERICCLSHTRDKVKNLVLDEIVAFFRLGEIEQIIDWRYVRQSSRDRKPEKRETYPKAGAYQRLILTDVNE